MLQLNCCRQGTVQPVRPGTMDASIVPNTSFAPLCKMLAESTPVAAWQRD